MPVHLDQPSTPETRGLFSTLSASACFDSVKAAALPCLDYCRTVVEEVSKALQQVGSGAYQVPWKKVSILALITHAGERVLGANGQVTASYQGDLTSVVNSVNVCYIHLTDQQSQDFTTLAFWVPSGEETGVRFERHRKQYWTASDFMTFGRNYYHHEGGWDFRSPLLLIKKVDSNSSLNYQIIASMLDNGGWFHNEWLLRDDSTEEQASTPSNPALVGVDLPEEVSATTQGVAGAWQETPTDGSSPHVIAFFGTMLENFVYNFTTPPFEVAKGIEPNQAYFNATGEAVLTILDETRTSFKLISHTPATGERNDLTLVSQLPRSYPYIFNPQTFATDDNPANTVVTVCATGPQKDGDTYSIDAAFINKETGEIYYAFQVAGGPTTGSPYYSLTTRQVGSSTYVATYRYEKNLWGVAFNKRGQMGVPFIINQAPIEEPGLALTSFYQMDGDPVTKGCSAWQTPNKTVTATNWVIKRLPPPVPPGMPYPDTVLAVPQLPVTTVTSRPWTTTSASFSTRAITPSPPAGNATAIAISVTTVALLVLVGISAALAFVLYRRRQQHLARTQHPTSTTSGTEMGAAQSQTARPLSTAYSPSPHRATSPPSYDSVPTGTTSGVGYDVAEAPLDSGHNYDQPQQPFSPDAQYDSIKQPIS